MTDARPIASVLSLSDIAVDAGGLRILSIDALRVPATHGVSAAIVGANGAGKSTFLNAVTGYVRVNPSGSILFQGSVDSGPVQLASRRRAWIVRAGVSRTFQTPSMLGALSVRKGIRLAAKTGAGWAISSAARRRRGELADVLIDTCGLSPVADRTFEELAPQQLRLADLARALACQPRLLLMDEPTAGADDEERDRVRRLLSHDVPAAVSALHRQGSYRFDALSIVVVTHDRCLLRGLIDDLAMPRRGDNSRDVRLGWDLPVFEFERGRSAQREGLAQREEVTDVR